jgi:hypothetical protein
MSEDTDKGQGYGIVDGDLGANVRAYTCNGASLSGTLTVRRGKFLRIEQNVNGRIKTAIVNMDHMSSLTL